MRLLELRPVFAAVICLVAMSPATFAQTPVYYSVGTDSSNLRSSAALTVDLVSGTATFSEAQADHVGVGDQVTYDGSTVAYISARISSTEYSLITATGGTPADIAGATVDSITRAFTSLSAAQAGSSDGSHLGVSDLVAGGFQLNWACYDDGPLDDRLDLAGWTTGPNHYIRIYTPVGSSEVGVSQRHTGHAGTGFRVAPVDATVAAYYIIFLRTEYVRIEGVELDGTGLSAARSVRGIGVAEDLANAGDIRISSNIIHDLHTTQGGNDFDGSFGIYAFEDIDNQGPPLRVKNNFIYDVTANISEDNHHVGGIHISTRTTSWVYNNTIFHIRNTGAAPGGATWGIEVSAWPSGTVTVVARNNFVGDLSSTNDVERAFEANNGGGFTQSNNVSSDATAAGAGSQTNQTSYASYFVSVTDGSEDLHLLNDSASLWSTTGADLDSDPDLPVTHDIDRETRHATTPDIGADEFLGDCSPLSTTEGASTITVTAPDSFEMVFNQAQGGALEEYYDLAEDPSRTYNLAGKPTANFFGLFHDSITSSGTLHTSGTNTNGAELQLLEATPTRVRVRQENFFQQVSASTILPGIKSYGDYSIYPSGKMGLHWNRKTTASVPQEDHPLEVSARREAGPDPRDGVTLYHDLGTASPQVPGDSDFLLSVRDTAGARADILAILHQDWALASQVDFQTTVAFGSWRDLNVGTLPSGLDESWDFLFYHKPTTFTDHTDVTVLERRDDYRGADPISVITAGSGWNENPADADFFNESEGAYTFDFDMAAGLTFEMDGATTNRFSPFFKIRTWRSLQDPSVTLEGAALANDADFKADVKPFARAFFAQDLTWYSTLQDGTAVTAPNVGTGGTVNNGNDFQPSPYGNGARIDVDGEYLTLPAAGNFDPTQGSIEFWYQPNYVYGSGAGSDDHGFFGYWIDANNYFYGVHQPYLGGAGSGEGIYFRVSSGGTVSQVILGAGPSFPELWRANDWVHLRFSWLLGGNLEVYVNGDLRGSVAYTAAPALPGDDVFYIGERNVSGTKDNNAEGIIDELRIYSTPGSPTPIAHAGLTANGNEALASGSNEVTLNFAAIDGSGRGEYAYFGTDAKFRGLNVSLATFGEGSVDLQWEYWNATSGSWDNLETFGFTDETSHFTAHGTIYWTSDPTDWGLYSLAGGPDLYYVRAHLASGSYTTAPVEHLIKTDILLFQYCGHITLDNQEFSFAVPAPTAVELASFDAAGGDGQVVVSWSTALELDNLGFHLYRSTSADGVYTRVTSQPIPGLGSSPVGASYQYVDDGVTNGVTYFYELEDIETTGRTKRHGPVSATPTGTVSGGVSESRGSSEKVTSATRITYGDPSANRLRVLREGKSRLVLELVTAGFYAHPEEDGSVRIEIPGLGNLTEPDVPAIPVKRTWIEAIAGRRVELASVTARDVEAFTGLRPSNAELRDLEARVEGTVRAARRRTRGVFRGEGLYPAEAARIVNVGFQGETKKALMELAPLRWDGNGNQLLLARRLVVRVSFRGREPAESSDDGVRGRRYRRRPSHRSRGVVARLVTTAAGLHAVGYDDVLGRGRGVASSTLRLSRQDRTVAFRIEPNPDRFEPGSTLYFVSESAAVNPYANELVYELEQASDGEVMPEIVATPDETPTPFYWHELELEENRLYQAALLAAPDLWLWDVLFAPVVKSFPFEVTTLVPTITAGELSVWLQGASDADGLDHHVRVYVNGTLLDDVYWDGKRAHRVHVDLPSGILVEGNNLLELENVGDTGAPFSMVMLDRFRVRYPRRPVADDGRLEGHWSASGAAEIAGVTAPAHVVDVTEEPPRWLTGALPSGIGSIRFSTRAGRRYLVASAEAVHRPEVRTVPSARLKSPRNRADYVILGPRALVREAGPLLELRQRQGLDAKGVAIEDVYSEFGFGEPTPASVREFLSYAYHQWGRPSLRYVVLLGDASFDFKDYLATGVVNHVPPMIVETSYLWTASDPVYAAVNGEDLLPDLALGRLPVSTAGEARVLVDKIVAYELGETTLADLIVLVADDPDVAGDFVANADDLASGALAGRNVRKIYLSELGTTATRSAILEAFDDGASLTSYIGHGGIHLWGDELFFKNADVASMASQSQQPLLLTMNCLNGYFHFPYFDSLAEELLQAPGKGAIAAFAPSGLSLNTPAHRFHEALLRAIFSGEHARLGDAVLAAQEEYASSGAFPELLTIYNLLGDPALRLK